VAIEEWEEFWSAVRPVELTATVERQAGELTHRRALRGADAVHLASALAVESRDLVIAVWDRRLHKSAIAEQLLVAPATLPR
jgi:predicted nucleic acid-binding protein